MRPTTDEFAVAGRLFIKQLSLASRPAPDAADFEYRAGQFNRLFYDGVAGAYSSSSRTASKKPSAGF